MVATSPVTTGLFALSAVLPLLLLPPAMRNREKPGVRGLVVIVLSASAWSATSVGISVVSTPVGWWVVANLRMLAVTGVVSGLVLTTLEYTGRLRLTRRVVAAVATYPLAVQLAVWTNPLHALFYVPFEAVAVDLLVVPNSRGLFLVHTVVAFAQIFASLGLLLVEVVRSGGRRRLQSLVLLSAPLPPSAVNVLLTAGLIRGIDPTPPAFILSVLIMTWALVYTEFFDIVPLGRYRVVETMNDPTVTLDTDDRVVDANPAAQRLVGVDDWEGTPVVAFFEPCPEVADAVDGGIEETELSVVVDDQKRHFDLDCAPIYGPQDDPRGRLLVFREITELKQREQQLRERERELRAKNEALDRFASVVSHDVATPLGVIENKAQLIEMTDDPTHVDDILDASQQVRELVDELRALAAEGEQVGETEAVDLEAVTREAWTAVAASGADLSVASTRQVEADRDRLRQLLENLLRNSVEHGSTDGRPTADGGGERDSPGSRSQVHDAADGGDVAITVGALDGDSGFYVEDDGPGIPVDQRETIFEEGVTSGADNTGLGLAIVQRIVDGHGWTVTATESEAGGARFEIRTA